MARVSTGEPRADSATGLLNVCMETNDRGHTMYRVEIRVKRGGARLERVKRFGDLELAVRWRDKQRKFFGLPEAND